MTTVDVVFRYNQPPNAANVRAIQGLREVYGIRLIRFDETERTVRVEYDASRLSEDTVAGLLRRTGLELGEKLQLV
jgi:hypothetical protein